MLAPQQTMMRANANLRCEGAAASLQALGFLDFEHPTLQGVGNGDMVPRALPWARDLLPFQGARGEGCGDSTVAHFARKVRGAKVGASALKGQTVLSPGQRPGCQRINANAL